MRPGLRLAPLGGVATLALAVTACAWSLPPLGGGAPGGPTPEAIELRASRARNARLEREVERLRADVREAEDTLVAIESGMRGGHTRADAVMALAEARIEVGRVAQQAPWAPQSVKDAQTLLEEADRHIRAERFGAAIFFTSRARRAAATLQDEAERASSQPGARFVTATRANLRQGPSTEHGIVGELLQTTPVVVEEDGGVWLRVRTPHGQVGWIHATLVASRR